MNEENNKKILKQDEDKKSSPALSSGVGEPKRSLRFKIGLFFLVINVPFGYGGGALAAALGVKIGKPALGAGLGIVIYAISWIMLGLGVWMAGPEGVQLVNDLRKKLFSRSKKKGGEQ
jgi:hypothetical protein